MAFHRCTIRICNCCLVAEMHRLFRLSSAHVIWEGFLYQLNPKDLTNLDELIKDSMEEWLAFLKDHLSLVTHNMKYYNWYADWKHFTATDIEDFVATQEQDLEGSLMMTDHKIISLESYILTLAGVDLAKKEKYGKIALDALYEIIWIHLYFPNEWETPEDVHIPEIQKFLERLDTRLLASIMRRKHVLAARVQDFLEHFNPAEYFKENTATMMSGLKFFMKPGESGKIHESDYYD